LNGIRHGGSLPFALDDGTWTGPGGRLAEEEGGRRFLLLVILLAAVLRFYRLGADSLWIDEVFTWRMVNPGPGHGFWEQFRDNIQGPLYMAALWPLVRDNLSEFLMRLPAALAGVAAVPLVMVLGRDIGGRRSGEWAALIMAVNPFHLWYSQEARGYAFLILWSLAATLVLVRMLRDGPTVRRGIAYGLLTGLAVLSNMSALFLAAAQALAVLVCARPWRGEHRWAWVTAYGLVALVSLPWLLQATGYWYVGRLAPEGGGGLQPAGNTALSVWVYPFTVYAMFYGFTLGPTLTELHRPDRMALVKSSLPVLAPAGLLAGALFLHGLARLRSRVRPSVLLWLAVPVLLLTALRLADVKTFTPRYLATLLPLLLCVTALGLARLPGRASAIVGVAWLALTAWSTANYHLSERYARDDVRAAADWIAERDGPGEPVLVPVVTDVFSLYYDGDGVVKDFWACDHIGDLEAARRLVGERVGEAPGAWLVLSRSAALDPDHHLPTALSELGRIDTDRSFPGVRLLRAVREGAPPPETGEVEAP